MEILINVGGHRVIINVQSSQIGFGYGRLFIEVVPEENYINFDLTLGATFAMSVENWNDWLSGAEVVRDEDDIRTILQELGVSYDRLTEALQQM